MVGAALTWDWLYNDLDPAFREMFRQVLWEHARVMYYGGHKGGNPEGDYWRGKPAYNHRWFRDWGLTLAALGAAEGKPEEQWLLSEVEKELQFMAAWMPADGSQHEGPGYGSSAGALGMAFEVSDDLSGTHYLDAPFYKTVAAYTMQISAPGMAEALYFADCWTKEGSFHPFFLKTAAAHKQADVMDGIRHALQIHSKDWGTVDSAWEPLIYDDPSITGGHYANLPTSVFPPGPGDLHHARFLAGPGRRGDVQVRADGRLQSPTPGVQPRRRPTGSLPYLNVAHDHPDANSFIIFGDGEYLAETDRYCRAAGQALLQRQHDPDQRHRPGCGRPARRRRLAAARQRRHDRAGQDHRLQGRRRRGRRRRRGGGVVHGL